MGKNNNRNVKVIQRVDSEEELKQITLARKEAMQKKAKKESDSEEEDEDAPQVKKSLVSDIDHQRNLERLEKIKQQRELAARQREEEKEALEEKKRQQAEILKKMAEKKQAGKKGKGKK